MQQSGCERALRLMARRYANWRVPADDLEQEGRIAAWQAEATFDGRGTLNGYRLMAARGAMLNALTSPHSNRAGRAPVELSEHVAGRDFAPMLIDVLSPPAPTLPSVTAQKVETLRLMTREGLTQAEAARRLCLAPSTVAGHLQDIYRAWGVSGLIGAYNFAMAHGYIDPPDRVSG